MSGSGAFAWPTRATAAWAPAREPARAPSASRPSRHSAARSPATGRRSSEVRQRKLPHSHDGFHLNETDISVKSGRVMPEKNRREEKSLFTKEDKLKITR